MLWLHAYGRSKGFLHVLWSCNRQITYAQPTGYVRFACGQRVVVICRDTAVLVFFFFFFFFFRFKHQLPRDSTLPVFHAVTGCDTVSQFPGHGKVTTWKAFEQNKQLLKSLSYSELTEEIHLAF